jgi:seryl-tRNA synthetase
LKGPGFRLNQALINYGIDFLSEKEYIPLQTPFVINKDVMSATAQLEDFDEQLYKVF